METQQLLSLVRALLSAAADGDLDLSVADLLREAGGDLRAGQLTLDRALRGASVRSFEEAGVLSREAGLRLSVDGDSFDVVVRG